MSEQDLVDEVLDSETEPAGEIGFEYCARCVTLAKRIKAAMEINRSYYGPCICCAEMNAAIRGRDDG